MPDRLLLISAIIDVATSEAARPLKEFFRRPRLPIREMYLTRVIINLVYFARNYLNIVLLVVAVLAFAFPMVLLVLGAAGLLHVAKRRSREPNAPRAAAHISMAAKVVQLVACIIVLQVHGLVPLLIMNATPMVLVSLHAAFTPYTDDAMEHYEEVMAKKGFHAPAPRSPTQSYKNVDKMFEKAIHRSSPDDLELPSGTSPVVDPPASQQHAPLSPRRGSGKALLVPPLATASTTASSEEGFTNEYRAKLLNTIEGSKDAPPRLSLPSGWTKPTAPSSLPHMMSVRRREIAAR